MTFSQALKDELLVLDILPEIAKIELIAIFKAIGHLDFNEDGMMIEDKTRQIKLIKRLKCGQGSAMSMRM